MPSSLPLTRGSHYPVTCTQNRMESAGWGERERGFHPHIRRGIDSLRSLVGLHNDCTPEEAAVLGMSMCSSDPYMCKCPLEQWWRAGYLLHSSRCGSGLAGFFRRRRLLHQILACSFASPSPKVISAVVVRRHLRDEERKLFGYVDARKELLGHVGVAVSE
jgi:hypothetical protein